MLVGFDYQIFAEHEYGGISRYFFSLATTLAQFPGVQSRVLSPLYVNNYLLHAPPDIVTGNFIRPRRGTRRLILGASATIYRATAAYFRPDIIHETYYTEHYKRIGHACHVLTVFDMIHERCPESFPAYDRTSAIKAAAIHRADHLFCISESTKRDLIDIHRIPESKITVTYLAADPLPTPNTGAESLVGAEPYLLHVGGRHGYKNFSCFLRAYATSKWVRNNFRIVCFGGGKLTDSERLLMVELGIAASAVVQLGGSDELLSALYQGAAALIYPSSYEGFGIPPLEAMSLGCPVICSMTSSIPEVVGEAGEYFDPYDVESIKHAIERVLQSSTRRSELISLGSLRCKLFSWERCAQETLNIYKRLVV